MEVLIGHQGKSKVLKVKNYKLGELIKPKVKTILRKRKPDGKMFLPASTNASHFERSIMLSKQTTDQTFE